jgi:hypothetical protein
MTTTLKPFLWIGIVFLIVSSASAKTRKSPAALVNWKDVPAAAQATIETNAAGGKVREIEKHATNGLTSYRAEVKGTDGKWSKIYVQEAGDLIRVEPDKARNNRKHKPLFGG